MTSRFQLPPIVKDAQVLLADIERAVRNFPQYYRYRIGDDLRRHAMEAFHLAGRAWRDKQHQGHWLDQLVITIDRVKEHLQTSKDVQALSSFKLFEKLWKQAAAIGAQAGGWRRHLAHPSAQNAQGSHAVGQRGQKLSTQAAPAGVYP